jgi:SAM-dependent methyltransferase
MLENEKIYTCEICKSKQMSKIFTVIDRVIQRSDSYSLVKCANCNQVSLYPMPSAEEINAFYPKDIEYYGDKCKDSFTSKIAGSKNKLFEFVLSQCFNYPVPEKVPKHIIVFARFIIAFFRGFLYRHPRFQLPNYIKNGKLLEIGFGSGGAMRQFNSLGWNVIGTESSMQRCLHLESTHGFISIHTSTFQVPLEDKSVDVIYLNQVFEHMLHPQLALQEYWRLLKPGGQVLMTVPNFACLQSRLAGASWRGIEAPRHLYLYTEKTLEALLCHANFKDIFIKPVSLSIIDLVKFYESPNPANNDRHSTVWWNNRFLYILNAAIAPSLGFGESLFITAKKS